VEVHWGLAMLHAQLGNAAEAREACRAGLALSPGGEILDNLTRLQRLLPSGERE
jgi:hypothetical protein